MAQSLEKADIATLCVYVRSLDYASSHGSFAYILGRIDLVHTRLTFEPARHVSSSVSSFHHLRTVSPCVRIHWEWGFP